jgi:hypothetical protein
MPNICAPKRSVYLSNHFVWIKVMLQSVSNCSAIFEPFRYPWRPQRKTGAPNELGRGALYGRHVDEAVVRTPPRSTGARAHGSWAAPLILARRMTTWSIATESNQSGLGKKVSQAANRDDLLGTPG